MEVESEIIFEIKKFGVVLYKYHVKGTEYFIDRDLVIPNKDISIRDGAIAPWSRTSSPSPYYPQTLMALSEHYSFSIDFEFYFHKD